jgi:hypothetical protein
LFEIQLGYHSIISYQNCGGKPGTDGDDDDDDDDDNNNNNNNKLLEFAL